MRGRSSRPASGALPPEQVQRVEALPRAPRGPLRGRSSRPASGALPPEQV
eukprot:CAMPEP_0204512812 /NCGR_PEP_ID=MMETSP0661-20131031/1155_1 /ASSEMBLY_ACC=CAM_ASM_000606 /TAXON_ID=109239 /ORGANISM="Alexandrium margalefi, Strain AMGDE01CS-322" /LENGTH=49 /DNA_ID= /DNA_START= /DNA_END= /DNA_ORIENTATION=